MTKTSDEITQELIDWQFGDGLLKQDTKPGTKFVDKFASKSPTEVYIPGKYKSEPGEEAMFTSSVRPSRGVWSVDDIKGSVFTSDYIEGGTPKSRSR